MPSPTYLLELPLPAHWDRRAFKVRGKANQGNFDRAVAVALHHAAELGRGSSRVAYQVQYAGRRTVLKIAHRLGTAQNQIEIKALFRTPEIYRSSFVIPGIDYDRHNSIPLWVHTEYAEPVTMREFIRHASVNPAELTNLLSTLKRVTYRTYGSRGTTPSRPSVSDVRELLPSPRLPPKLNPRNPLVLAMVNVQLALPAIDFSDCPILDNWGVYDDRLVIIDGGLLM